MPAPILVTGATGAVGRLVVSRLLASGAPVHALTRDPSKARLPAGVELVAGDLVGAPVPARAFAGVQRLFLFPAQGPLDGFLGQAARAGVGQVVVLSSLAAALEHERDRRSASARHHLEVERAARASGMAVTVLRPGTFASNLLAWAPSIQATGSVTGPYPTSAQAPLHEADLAEAAAAALLGEGHRGATYPLTGPRALTRVEQLQAIGRALGRELRFQACSPEAFAAAAARFLDQGLVSMLLDSWRDTAATPEVVRSVEALTGKPGRTLDEWARDHRADFGREAGPG